ncbi:MAG TPA: glycine cleavage system protein R [Porticoccaceae bacterium]|nr:glycine cleavage system protein R [Porticoccaceae bacterium]
MHHQLVLTIITDDRPGVIDNLANTIRRHHGNWLESSMAHLAGKFTGILLVDVADRHRDGLLAALKHLEQDGLRITVEAATAPSTPLGQCLDILLTGNDRPGIVGEVSGILADHKVNIEQLNTWCENAPMSGEALFRLEAQIQLPPSFDTERLQSALETLSDDLVVEFQSPASKA